MYSRVAIYTLYPTSKHFIEGEKQHLRMFLHSRALQGEKFTNYMSVVNISAEERVCCIEVKQDPS